MSRLAWVNIRGARLQPCLAGLAVFRHVATLGIVAALVDWLVLDWLLIRYLQPAWIIPVGTDAGSWRNTRDIVKDALGFFPIGTGVACVWAYAVSRWILA